MGVYDYDIYIYIYMYIYIYIYVQANALKQIIYIYEYKYIYIYTSPITRLTIPNDSNEIVRILSQPSGEPMVGMDHKVRDVSWPSPGRATHILVARSLVIP